jgi:hypothetical protein
LLGKIIVVVTNGAFGHTNLHCPFHFDSWQILTFLSKVVAYPLKLVCLWHGNSFSLMVMMEGFAHRTIITTITCSKTLKELNFRGLPNQKHNQQISLWATWAK